LFKESFREERTGAYCFFEGIYRYREFTLEMGLSVKMEGGYR